MHGTQKIGLLMATVAVLAACGASEPLSGLSPPPAPAPPALSGLSCTAPDPAADLNNTSYVGPCISNLKAATSNRNDILIGNTSLDAMTISYTDSTNCQGTNTVVTSTFPKLDVGTTTLASLASDGITTVTGVGYQIAITSNAVVGTEVTVGVAATTSTFTLCRSRPSTTTLNVSPYFSNFPNLITPTFSIRLSLPNTPTIVLTPVFDEVGNCFYNCT
jgi:hypothetical protein